MIYKFHGLSHSGLGLINKAEKHISMERNNMNESSNSFKDHNIGSKFIRDSGNNKTKDYSWNNSNCKIQQQQQQQSCYGEEYLSGCSSWPPRTYTCSFCKREFRSAQALGGHMNVHRRDRARLRMSPPTPREDNNSNINGQYPFLNLNLNPNPNPNPNPKVISTPLLVSPFSTSFSSQSPASASEMNKWVINGTLSDPISPKDSVKEIANLFTGADKLDECKLKKKAEIVRLDLEIGLISDSKEDLDLELRLGNS